MNPGKLDQLVTIQSRTVAPNGVGDAVETFATLGQRWAQLVATPGDESVDSQQRVGKEIQDFRVRFDTLTDEINPTYRVSWNGVAWDIASVTREPAARPEFLLLKCWRNTP